MIIEICLIKGERKRNNSFKHINAKACSIFNISITNFYCLFIWKSTSNQNRIFVKAKTLNQENSNCPKGDVHCCFLRTSRKTSGRVSSPSTRRWCGTWSRSRTPAGRPRSASRWSMISLNMTNDHDQEDGGDTLSKIMKRKILKNNII